MLDLQYIFKESFRGFKQSKLMSFVSVAIITCTLIMIGSFLFATVNVRKIVEIFRDKVEIEVFLFDDFIEARKRQSLEEKLLLIKGVTDVMYISKAAAMEIFKKEFDEDMLGVIESNPFPSSFRLQLADQFKSRQHVEKIAAEVRQLEGVEDVEFGENWLPVLDRLIVISFLVFISVATFLSLVSVFIVSNTIKLTVLARQEIISIMKLVGAKDNFIRYPFFVEGILQGLLGGIIATGCIALVLHFPHPFLPEVLYFPNNILWVLIGLGSVLGACGSWTSIQKFLRL